jgi:hypothetical protein
LLAEANILGKSLAHCDSCYFGENGPTTDGGREFLGFSAGRLVTLDLSQVASGATPDLFDLAAIHLENGAKVLVVESAICAIMGDWEQGEGGRWDLRRMLENQKGKQWTLGLVWLRYSLDGVDSIGGS